MRRLSGLCGDTRLYTFSDNHDVEAPALQAAGEGPHPAYRHPGVHAVGHPPPSIMAPSSGVEGRKEWGSDWPLRPCLDLADYPDCTVSHPIAALYAALGRLKASEPALTYGRVEELVLTTERYAFARVLDGRALVTVLNNAGSPAQVEFLAPVPADAAQDLLAGLPDSQDVPVQVQDGRVTVQLPANYGTILALGC